MYYVPLWDISSLSNFPTIPKRPFQRLAQYLILSIFLSFLPLIKSFFFHVLKNKWKKIEDNNNIQ